MKHLCTTLACLLGMSGTICAQEFEPSNQAKGLLESKNMTVDHTTGTFHYKVPLYTLHSGTFQLPLSIDYMGQGVKYLQDKGLLDYNWTLNTGGVVTRTVRGGIADETPTTGFIRASQRTDTPLWEDAKNVNTRKRDGECDIFTAVCNGKAVNFIIQADSLQRIYAIPLEKTDIRIKCLQGDYINGWEVTDGCGNRYIYSQKEWTLNVRRENANSDNSIRGGQHVSAWYLTRIEPMNAAPIRYEYIQEVDPQNAKGNPNVHQTTVSDAYGVTYCYGKPVREHTFDFRKYRPQYEQEIRMAREYLQGFSREIELAECTETFSRLQEWHRNPAAFWGSPAFQQNYRIMGMLINLQDVSEASAELIQVLTSLYDTYRNLSSQNAQMATSCFLRAKQLAIQSLKEIEEVQTRQTTHGATYEIYSPVLKSIHSHNEMVAFTTFTGSRRIEHIEVQDLMRKSRKGIAPGYGTKGLEYLSFLDAQGQETERMAFKYFNSGAQIQIDEFGYHQDIKHKSLKTITLKDGGQVILDYERNQLGENSNPGIRGGLRIASIVLKDAYAQKADTVTYQYAGGQSLYERVSKTELVSYKDFTDVLEFAQYKNFGAIYAKTGNNGLYYRYVKETLSGKGANAYWFQTPPNHNRKGYEFWKCGLLIGQAAYDAQGHLIQLQRNTYESTGYTQQINQLSAYDYYLDPEETERNPEFRGQVRFCPEYTYDVYNEFYKPNIEPRLHFSYIPDLRYTLLFGGATVLTEQALYRFDAARTTAKGAHISDLNQFAQGVPHKKIQYLYDTTRSIYPQTIIETDSQGKRQAKNILRVAHMDEEALPLEEAMRESNFVSSIVKEAETTEEGLVSEQVHLYRQVGRHIVPEKRCLYLPAAKTGYDLQQAGASLYTFDAAQYQTEETYGYQEQRDVCLPITVQKRTEVTGACYDFFEHSPLLKAEGATGAEIAAADRSSKCKDFQNALERASIHQEVLALAQEAVRVNDMLYKRLYICPEKFISYTKSTGYKIMWNIIDMLAYKEDALPDMEQMNLYLKRIRENNDQLLFEFIDQYKEMWMEIRGSVTDFNILSVIEITERFIRIPDFDYSQYFEYRYLHEYIGKFSFTRDLSTSPRSRYVSVYVISDTHPTRMEAGINHANGTDYISAPVEALGKKLYRAVFDLDGYEGIGTFTVDNYNYTAIVPEGVAFEAISYNFDGTIAARFDHTGQAEFYDYDAAGRVIKVTDQNGKTLRTYDYHRINQP